MLVELMELMPPPLLCCSRCAQAPRPIAVAARRMMVRNFMVIVFASFLRRVAGGVLLPQSVL